jgi:hypothetical protein
MVEELKALEERFPELAAAESPTTPMVDQGLCQDAAG